MTHLIVELLRIKAACPKLADSDPSEMTDDERERFMKERSQRWSQRCSPVIYSSNMRREILPDILHNSFFLLNKALMSLWRLSGRARRH